MAGIILPGVNDLGKAGDEFFHGRASTLNPRLESSHASPSNPRLQLPAPYAIALLSPPTFPPTRSRASSAAANRQGRCHRTLRQSRSRPVSGTLQWRPAGACRYPGPAPTLAAEEELRLSHALPLWIGTVPFWTRYRWRMGETQGRERRWSGNRW